MDTASQNVLDRARADIEAGRPWKARDRLQAAVAHDPTNQPVLELLSEVYYEMKDLPNAGRFWLLTDRSDPATQTALAEFEARWGGNLGEKLKMVPLGGPIDGYPPVARERLSVLREQARAADIEWPPPPQHEHASDAEDDEGIPVRQWPIVALLVIVGPGLWLLGIVAVIYMVVTWLS